MLSLETLRTVAANARLALTAKEEKRLLRELNEVLEAFSVLDAAPAGRPVWLPIAVAHRLRPDVPRQGIGQKALQLAVLKQGQYFLGPKCKQ